MAKLVLMISIVSVITSIAVGAETWLSSLGISERQSGLFVDAHFEDSERKNLVIEASHYRLAIDFAPKLLVSALTLGGENVIENGVLRVESGGRVYTSDMGSRRARMNIWRFGPYFYEVHVLGLPLTGADGTDFPGTAAFVFYCYPEKFHIEAVVRPSDDVLVDSGGFTFTLREGFRGTTSARSDTLCSSVFSKAGSKSSFASVGPASTLFGESDLGKGQISGQLPSGQWKKGDEKSSWFAILPAGEDGSERLSGAVRAELEPLKAEDVVVESGGAFDGYDHVRGHYVIRGMPALAAHGFEAFWVNPNDYLTVSFSVRNDDLPRRMYVKHYTSLLGGLEAGVVTDKHGFPLPIPVQVCKNFAGEGEEPDDTAFGESYFPLALQPGQELSLRSHHLHQNWGNSPLKQVSSIRFFEHYYHLSTGVTETTCYVPLTKFAHGGSSYTIADFRGMSGITWLGQPQHHHVALIGFLQYNDGEPRHLRYLNTDFEYISPNLAKFTMNYMSYDDKIKASVNVMEIPQLDETRSFVRIRYDVLDTVQIAGDARRNLRFVNANTDITRNRYQKVAYLDENNEVKEVALTYDYTWALEGVRLGKEYPFICMYASPKSNCAFVVTGFAGRIGGKPMEHISASAVGYSNQVAEKFFTVDSAECTLMPGDYWEADVILMPYGYDWHDWRPPNRERTYYGSNGPKLDAFHGVKVADFPGEIEALDGYAEFQISGGHDYLPFIVKGLPRYNAPMLWEKTGRWNFIDQQVRGNDWYQVVAGEKGFDFVFLTRQRNGMQHHYLVTQASAQSPIESIRSESGEAVIRTEKHGRMEVLSPRLFEGLSNGVRAGSDVVHSTGIAREVRTIPVLATATEGAIEVKAKKAGCDGYDLTLEGAGKLVLSFGYLAPEETYAVQIGEATSSLSVDKSGVLSVPVEVSGEAVVVFRRAG